MATMPEIGSKISLISKADIRYEGKLFTVDPNDCTIALSCVRSFGTEDRQAQFPVPPQSQIYEYILFRGSDIKDISIINSQQLPNDPAIVSGMAPSSLQSSNYQPHGFGHNMIGNSMTPSLSQYGYNPMNSMVPGIGRGLPNKQPSSELVNVHIPEPMVQVSALVTVPPPVNIPPVKEPNSDLIAGSRASTPGLISRKSPTMDQGVQVSGPSPNKEDKSQMKAIQPPGQRDGRYKTNDRNYHYQDMYNHQQRDYRRDQMRRDPYSGQVGQQQRIQSGNRTGVTGWVNRGNMGNARARGRGGRQPGVNQQNFNRAPGTGQGQQQMNANKKSTLKFEGDYDFDKANTEFEELRSQLSKVKIGDPDGDTPKVNGEDKKDDSGNETGLGEGEQDEDGGSAPVYYDKNKSFFDNISCEAVERSKGRSQRTDWRTERKLNSETFGVASTRRGNYRGRGGYYQGGRGMYRNYRGGYNRGQGGRPFPRPTPATTQNTMQSQPAQVPPVK